MATETILSLIKKLPWPLRLIGINLYSWCHFSLALLPHPKIKKGDRFIAVEDIDTMAMVHYYAPFTDGFECVIPENTILIANHDSDRISIGFCCTPENEGQFEEMHVPEEIRVNSRYAGYSFTLRYSEIGKKYRKI